MKRWIAKLFYYKRIRRLERVQYAAALLAQGNTDEAAAMLVSAEPTAWVDDLAVYHFVQGKLCMETGALDEADRHLQAAQALGLDRAAVKLNLAVLRVRQCQLTEALDLLDDAELAEDPTVLEQARVMRGVIREADRNPPYEEAEARAERFRKKHFSPSTTQTESFEHDRRRLEDILHQKTKLSTKHLEDAALFYGACLTRHHAGSWVFGLEPRDHRVAARGVLYHPYALVSRLRDGVLACLPSPGHLAELPASSAEEEAPAQDQPSQEDPALGTSS